MLLRMHLTLLLRTSTRSFNLPDAAQREELAAVHTSATSAALQHQPQQQQQQQQLQPTPAAGAGSTIDAGDGLRLASAAEEQPLLFYSVRAQPPPGQEAPPLDGPPLDADTLPLSSDPDGKLLGQVNLVEAGRVHGWACVKGSQADALTVTVYVDGVQVGASQAVLPTQTSHVRQLCQLDPPGGAAAAAEEALQEAALHVGRGGVGFVVPLPPLAEGLHVVRLARVLFPKGCCCCCRCCLVLFLGAAVLPECHRLAAQQGGQAGRQLS